MKSGDGAAGWTQPWEPQYDFIPLPPPRGCCGQLLPPSPASPGMCSPVHPHPLLLPSVHPPPPPLRPPHPHSAPLSGFGGRSCCWESHPSAEDPAVVTSPWSEPGVTPEGTLRWHLPVPGVPRDPVAPNPCPTGRDGCPLPWMGECVEHDQWDVLVGSGDG